MREFKLYKSPWRAIKLMLLASIFVLLGWGGILTGKLPGWFCWTSIGFFALAYPVGLFHLFDRRPQIIINEFGIFDRSLHKEIINWEIILDAYPFDVSAQKFICLVLDRTFKSSKAKFNESLGMMELNIPLGQIKVDENKLLEFILLMRNAEKPARQKLLAESHSQVPIR